jgi:hypothetical protein
VRLRRVRSVARRPARWIVALLPLALLLGMLGRGHALQAIGLVIDCVHPDAATSDHADHAESDEGVASHDHCPSNCSRCPCGQMPTVMPPDESVPVAAFSSHDLAPKPRGDTPGQAHTDRLDRPPRTARARVA